MSNRGVPAWASVLNLTILFWVGIGLAPVSAIIMLISDSGGTFKLAMICGLGSIVLIGMSVALRRDADDVEAELGDEIAKLDMDTRRSLAELRTQLRQLSPDGPRAERSAERYRDESRGTRPIEGRRDVAVHEPRRHETEFDGGEPTADTPIPPRRSRRADSRHDEYATRDESRRPRADEDTGAYRSRGAAPRRTGRADIHHPEAEVPMHGPGDGWGDSPTPRRDDHRDADYRRGHSDEQPSGAWGRAESAEPRRRRGEARRISDREAEPQARWSDYDQGSRSTSRPDDYYDQR